LAKARDSAHPVEFTLSESKHPTKLGETRTEYAWYSSQKRGEVKAAKITLFEGNLKEIINHVANGGSFSSSDLK
jgi:hypothetical protein